MSRLLFHYEAMKHGVYLQCGLLPCFRILVPILVAPPACFSLI